jgi:hypothetical protein
MKDVSFSPHQIRIDRRRRIFWSFVESTVIFQAIAKFSLPQ